MIDGVLDLVIPLLMIASNPFDSFVSFLDRGHNYGTEVLRLEDYDFIIVLFALLVVCALTKQVGLLVGGSGFVVEREVILGEFCDPPSLPSVDLLRLLEVLEVLVIHPDFKVLCSAHEVVSPPLIEHQHDCEQFLVIDLIVMFHNGEHF